MRDLSVAVLVVCLCSPTARSAEQCYEGTHPYLPRQGEAIFVPTQGTLIGNFASKEDAEAAAQKGGFCVREGGLTLTFAPDGTVQEWKKKGGYSVWLPWLRTPA